MLVQHTQRYLTTATEHSAEHRELRQPCARDGYSDGYRSHMDLPGTHFAAWTPCTLLPAPWAERLFFETGGSGQGARPTDGGYSYLLRSTARTVFRKPFGGLLRFEQKYIKNHFRQKTDYGYLATE